MKLFSALQKEVAILHAHHLNVDPEAPCRISSASLHILQKHLHAYQELFVSHAKTAVVLTLVSLEHLDTLLLKISTLPTPLTLHIVIPIGLEEKLTMRLDALMHPAVIYSFDIKTSVYPTLFKVLSRLHQTQEQFICFLSNASAQTLSDDTQQEWMDISISPLFSTGDKNRDVFRFFTENDTSFIASADLYTSVQQYQSHAAPLIQQLLSKMQINEPTTDWGMLFDNNFWLRGDAVVTLLKHKSLLLDNSRIQQHGELSFFTAYVTMLLQRNSMNLTLIYTLDRPREHYTFQKASDQQRYSDFDLQSILNQNKKAEENFALLENTLMFDLPYYRKHPEYKNFYMMEPLLHFLRYGLFHNLAPSASFSPFIYISMYLESFQEGINPLRFFLEHQYTITQPVLIDYYEHKRIIAASKLFNLPYYKEKNRDVNVSKIDHLSHYCYRGWEEDRKPNPRFDAIWYKKQYLNDYRQPINALLHYILIGRLRGHKIRPAYTDPTPIETSDFPSSPKRITLFAAYDAEGMIDDTVISYVTELSRHSDVYFLADYDLDTDTLSKLHHITKGAWGIRHGEYDFGSYKRLSKYLVGWEIIAQYDELLLVNDSSYLLTPLDDVFHKMDATSSSWWGMQASKGIYETRDVPSNQYRNKIPITEIKESFLAKFEEDDIYDFHIGSYFLAFRQPVLKSGFLERFLNSVEKQRNKKNIILNYEVGLTRALINEGYTFETYIDHLYPFHPLYTNTIFEMIEDGYPFFKRFLLTRNHYSAPELWRWKDKILKKFPDADVTAMEKNLLRVCDAETLHKNLYIPLRYKEAESPQ